MISNIDQEDFFASKDHPGTSHVQLPIMGQDDKLRDYLQRLFRVQGTRGMTGKEVESHVHPSKRQGHNRQITALRRGTGLRGQTRRGYVLIRVPIRRGGGNVHIHLDHLTLWLNTASPEQRFELMQDDQW